MATIARRTNPDAVSATASGGEVREQVARHITDRADQQRLQEDARCRIAPITQHNDAGIERRQAIRGYQRGLARGGAARDARWSTPLAPVMNGTVI